MKKTIKKATERFLILVLVLSVIFGMSSVSFAAVPDNGAGQARAEDQINGQSVNSDSDKDTDQKDGAGTVNQNESGEGTGQEGQTDQSGLKDGTGAAGGLDPDAQPAADKGGTGLKKLLNDSADEKTVGDFIIKGDENNYSFKTYTEDENGKPEKGTLTITGDVTVTTKKATTQNIIIDADCKVVLAGVNIDSFAGNAILITAPHKVELVLKENSENILKGAPGKDINATKGSYSAIEPEFLYEDSKEPKNIMASLTISGNGSLKAEGSENAAGIGGSNSAGGSKGRGLYGNITINGGNITAVGTGGGAGIGSSNTPTGGTSVGSYKATGYNTWGTITINGGNIKATAGNAAGIGGGNHMDSGKVIINGGTIVASGNSGIGTGTGSSKAKGYDWKAEKGPGHYYADIEINGGDITATGSGWGGAGIGGGGYCDAKIVITDGNIKAYGGAPDDGHNALHHGGAGIGGGYEGHADITITGGNIYAAVGERSAAAAIGSGGTPNSKPSRDNTGRSTVEGITFLTETVVNISGGTIIADARAGSGTMESRGGAGIGGGVGADKVTVNITGGNIKAYGAKSDEENKIGGAGIGGGLYGVGIKAPGMSSAENEKYQVDPEVHVSITGGTVLAVGGWGASGIGSGANAQFAKTIEIDFEKASVEAYADGTKFAIDTRDLHEDGTTTSYTEGRTINGTMIQGTFVHEGEIGDYEQNPEGLNSIKITNDKTNEVKELTQMPEKYRSYATNVSEQGVYTVYTDDADIGHGEGRYFSVCSKDVYAEENVSKNMVQYESSTNELSDNFYLFPVKTVVVKKTVKASDGIMKDINGKVYFALHQKDTNDFLKKGDGTQWIEPIEIVKGVPQTKAYFVNIPDKTYDVWEVDKNGNSIKTGDEGYKFGSVTLLKIETVHGDDTTNNATLSDEIWTDTVEVVNTFDKTIAIKVKKVDAADKAKALEGAEFKLKGIYNDGYDGDRVEMTAVSDENGVATFTKVPFGSYDITETKAPNGYMLPDNPTKHAAISEDNVGEDSVFEIKFEDDKEYKVTHEFVSGTEGKTLPEEIVNRTPQDQTGKKDGDEVTPSDFDNTEVKTGGGTWVFVSWDEESKVIEGKDQKFIGTWVFTQISSDVRVKKVDEENPSKVLSGATFVLKGKCETEGYEDVEIEKTAVSGEDGTALFEDVPYGTYTVTETDPPNGYLLPEEKTQKVEIRDSKKEGKVYDLTFKDAPEYKVTHEFVSGTEGRELPEEIVGRTPDDQTGKKDGETVMPSSFDRTDLVVTDGTWSFTSWDEESKKIDGEDQKFTGIWVFTPLKSDVKVKKVDAADTSTVLKGAEFTLKGVCEAEGYNGVKIEKTAVSGEDGIALFEGIPYGTYTVTETKAPNNYLLPEEKSQKVEVRHSKEDGKIYELTFKDDKEYKVTHEFVSGTEGKDLPDVIVNRTPKDQTGKKDGDTVTPSDFDNTEVKAGGGTWVFVSWDEESKKIEGKDQKFIGTWVFTPVASDVKVKKVDAADESKVLEGAEFTLKGKCETEGYEAVEIEKTAVSGEDGIALFEDVPYGTYTVTETKAPDGYLLPEEKSQKVEVREDKKENKVYELTFKDDKEYKVTHEFVSGTEGKDLPDEIVNRTPKDQTGKKDGDTVTPSDFDNTEVKAGGGTWVFVSWDEESKKIDGEDQKFVGTWVFTPVASDVKVKKVDAADKDKVLEGAEFTLKGKCETEGYEAVEIEKTAVSGEDGIALFEDVPYGTYTVTETKAPKNYLLPEEKSQKVVVRESKKENKVYELTFKDDKEYKVTHEFVSGTEGKKLPEEIVNRTPKDQTGKKDGDTVTPSDFDNTEVKAGGGTWVFVSWDEESKKIDGEDQKFIGTWVFTQVTSDVKVKKVDAEDTSKVLEGAEFTLKGKCETEGYEDVEIEKTAVSGEDGIALFEDVPYGTYTVTETKAPKNYLLPEEKSQKVEVREDKKENKVYELTFKDAPEYKVKHEFVSGTDGRELPEEIVKRTPEDQTGKKDGDTVKPSSFNDKDLKVEDGTWSFESWDEESKKIDGEDQKFTGTWVFSPLTNDVKVIKVDAADKTKVLEGAEFTLTGKCESEGFGNTITLTETTGEDGTAVFKNVPYGTYTLTETKAPKDYLLPENASESVVIHKDKDDEGVLEFTFKDDKEYKVTHEFVSGTDGRELPEEIASRTPADQTGKKDGDTVMPSDFDKTDLRVEDGTWSFVSWDEESKKIEGEDQKFTGTWVYTPDIRKLKITKDMKDYFEFRDGKKKVDEANATVVFKVTIPDPDDSDKKLYENYISFTFKDAGSQSERIDIEGVSKGREMIVEEVYSAGYKTSGARKKVIDLTKYDLNELISVTFENEFDDEVTEKGGTINKYKDKKYVDGKEQD